MVFETLTVCKEGAVLFAKIAAPPMNLLGPELVRDLVSLIQRAEADATVQVLVFKSADPDYFISHVDVTRIKEYREEAAKLTGEPSIALLFSHLSASRLVTIAQIEGRVRGAGSEFILACDMLDQPSVARQCACRFRPIGRASDRRVSGCRPCCCQGPGQCDRACTGRGVPSPFRSLRRERAQLRGPKPDPDRDEARLPDPGLGVGPGPGAGRLVRPLIEHLT